MMLDLSSGCAELELELGHDFGKRIVYLAALRGC